MKSCVSTSPPSAPRAVMSARACPLATTQLAPKPTPSPASPTPNGPPRIAANISTGSAAYANVSCMKTAGMIVTTSATAAMPISSSGDAGVS